MPSNSFTFRSFGLIDLIVQLARQLRDQLDAAGRLSGRVRDTIADIDDFIRALQQVKSAIGIRLNDMLPNLSEAWSVLRGNTVFDALRTILRDRISYVPAFLTLARSHDHADIREVLNAHTAHNRMSGAVQPLRSPPDQDTSGEICSRDRDVIRMTLDQRLVEIHGVLSKSLQHRRARIRPDAPRAILNGVDGDDSDGFIASSHLAYVVAFMPSGGEAVFDTVNIDGDGLPSAVLRSPDAVEGRDPAIQLAELHRPAPTPITSPAPALQPPRSADTRIKLTSREPVAHGSSASIFRGTMRTATATTVVAVKVFHAFRSEDEQQSLAHEVSVWTKVQHAHVLPFYGTCTFNANQAALVCPYMENGNMNQYLRSHPSVDRLPLIGQVLQGLRYLHEDAGIVHGDLKCENILISDNGRAMVGDFGLSTWVAPRENITATIVRLKNTLRFAAPEVVIDRAYQHVSAADGTHARIIQRSTSVKKGIAMAVFFDFIDE